MAGVAALEPYIGKEDPNTLFELIEELAEGSFGTVYKVLFCIVYLRYHIFYFHPILCMQ